MKYRIWLAAALFSMVPVFAMASGTAILEQTDNGKTDTGKIAWTDAKVYIEVGGSGEEFDYAVLRDGHLYVVGEQNGETQVVDMGSMIKMFMGLAKSMGGEAEITSFKDSFRVQSIEPTGETPTIAGIQGVEYKVVVLDGDGKETTSQVVLTDNPLAVEMVQTVLSQMSQVIGQADLTDYVLDQLPDDMHGVLRVDSQGETMTVASLTDEAPDAVLFELPAPPVDFMQMMMKAMQQAQQAQ